MYKKNAIMFWKAVNGRDPDSCTDPIDISGMTEDDDAHGSHIYVVTYDGDKKDYIVGTVTADESMGWRVASTDEAKLIEAWLDDNPMASQPSLVPRELSNDEPLSN